MTNVLQPLHFQSGFLFQTQVNLVHNGKEGRGVPIIGLAEVLANGNKCGEFMPQGGESTKSYNTLRSQYPDEHTKFSKLKAKRDKARKERSKALNIGGLHQLTLHGGDTDKADIHK